MSECQVVVSRIKAPSVFRWMVIRSGSGCCESLVWPDLLGKPLLKKTIGPSYSLYLPLWSGLIESSNGMRDDETAQVVKNVSRVCNWIRSMVASYPFTTVYVAAVATAVAIVEVIGK
jgi:hypothetical protein